MVVYNFRVTIDFEKDVVRDIAIRSDQSFLELNDVIISSFEFKGDQMCSFFMSNEDWDKGEEIVLFDMGHEENSLSTRIMENTLLNDMIKKSDEKILYVYDFLRMWVFSIELLSKGEVNDKGSYPHVINSIGDAPDETDKSLEFDMPVDFLDEDDEEMDPELRDLLGDFDDESDYIDPDELYI